MNNLKLLLLLICVWPLTSQAQNQKKTTKTEVKNENLDSNFHHLKWRNIGPFRGGRSVTSTGVVGQPHGHQSRPQTRG